MQYNNNNFCWINLSKRAYFIHFRINLTRVFPGGSDKRLCHTNGLRLYTIKYDGQTVFLISVCAEDETHLSWS